MKRKLFTLLLAIVVFAGIIPLTVYADMGPKPSVNLQFDGLENQLYYITLLSKAESTGPYTAGVYHTPPDDYQGTDAAAWAAFTQYQDADGFYFLQHFSPCNSEQTYTWVYYPPSTFKVLLYFPETNAFQTSGIYERYAFDSYYLVKTDGPDLSSAEPTPTLALQKNYDYSQEILSLIARILATIAIEVLVALFFGLKQKNILLLILLTNIVTQTILNVLLNISHYFYGSLTLISNYVWMELLVVAIETMAYSLYFKKKGNIKRWVAPVYALSANAASFIVGLILANTIPGMF